MADSITSLAQQIRPFWLRDLGASASAQTGGGSGMIAHSLNGAYHTGTLDEAQAPWAVTDTEFSAHTGNADAHHARSHSITSTSDHTITASAYQLVGATGINTLGLLTPLNDVSAGDTAILRSASGTLTVATLAAGTRVRTPTIDTTSGDLSIAPTGGHVTIGGITLATSNNVGTEPDILLLSNGLIAAEDSIYLNIDSNASGTGAFFAFGKDAGTSSATELARLTESGRLGIGDPSPTYELDVVGTARATTALRTAETYSTTKVQTPLLDTSAGNMSITPVGDLVLDPGGSDVLPGGSIEDDLGDYNRKWRTLFAAELYVETLVAQDVLSTIGGRIEVTPTTTLIADLASGATTMDVKHNNLRQNEYAYMMAAPGGVAQVEAIKVTSTATVITGGYRYTITRNLDGTGGNNWVAGDAVASLGKSVGEGHISLTATSTIYNHLGPNITIYSRNNTAAWNNITPTVAVGNVESFAGYSTPTMGIAIGNDLTKEATTGFKGLTADATNGLRMFSTNISTYNGATKTFELSSDGTSMWIGPSDANKQLNYSSGSLTITGTITATAGAIANWNIGTVDANTLSSNNIRLIAGSVGGARVEVGTGTDTDTAGFTSGNSSTNVVLWCGETLANKFNAPFKVTLGGALTATSATITGAITANTGYIGGASGWAITTGQIASSNVRIISGSTTNARIELGTGSDANTSGIRGTDGTGTGVTFWSGATHANRNSAPFRVRLDGALIASSATITGDITATGGSITGDFYTGTNNNRFSTDGIRLKMPASSSLNINTSPAAFRWFETLDVSPTSQTNYVGMVGYRNTAYGNVIDALITSYVGNSPSTGTYYNFTNTTARVGLQAGNFDDATPGVYRSAYLLVIKDPGANDSGSIQCTASQTIIDGMLGLVPKAATTFTQDRATIYFSANGNLVIAFYNGTTTKYRYMSLTGTNATWTYTTSAPS